MLFPNQLMEQRITQFIDQALGCHGLKSVKANPDLLVSYRLIVTEQPQLVTYSTWATPAWNWAWGWGMAEPWLGGYAVTTAVPLYEGTLVIDIVDAKTGKLVFEGTSTQAVSSRPEKNVEKLAKAVRKVMANYPPRP